MRDTLELYEDVLSDCNLFFVYGTLQEGYDNNWRLKDQILLCETSTEEKFVMGNVGFPYIFRKQDMGSLFEDSWYKPVKGELYQVSDPRVVKSMDILEGEGYHYHRVKTETKQGDVCWVYVAKEVDYVKYCYTCSTTKEGEWKWK